MKALAWTLTAAAIVIGADVFAMSSDRAQPADATRIEAGRLTLHGGNGMPPPPPDAY